MEGLPLKYYFAAARRLGLHSATISFVNSVEQTHQGELGRWVYAGILSNSPRMWVPQSYARMEATID